MNPYDFYITDEEYGVAAANGIGRSTLNNRIRNFGWEKQKAMTDPVQPQRAQPEWRKIAELNGIRPDTFYARVNRYGWDPERAATEPPHQKPQELAAAARRKIPKEMFDLAASNGISEGAFKSRIYQSGWSIERAATEPTWSKQQVDAYGNQRYKEKYGANPNAVLFPHRAGLRHTSQ